MISSIPGRRRSAGERRERKRNGEQRRKSFDEERRKRRRGGGRRRRPGVNAIKTFLFTADAGDKYATAPVPCETFQLSLDLRVRLRGPLRYAVSFLAIKRQS